MHIYVSVLVLLFSVLHAFPAKQDSISPIGTLVYPRSFSVFNTNAIRIRAEANDRENDIKEVRFYVRYFGPADTSVDISYILKHIASKTAPPYEYIFTCSQIPDQDYWHFLFFCEIENSSGRISRDTAAYLVLDRKPGLKDAYINSVQTHVPIVIDGNIDEWAKTQGTSFNNGDNQITVFSSWDKAHLYFAVLVKDDNMENEFDTVRGPTDHVWLEDCIELFFDTKHDHGHFRHLDDKQIVIAPNGGAYGEAHDLQQRIRLSWIDLILYKVRLMGTLNNPADKDSGYSIEVAIPWHSLELEPRKGLEMGFDVFNNDKEYRTGYRTGYSWSGNERSNNNNPSEWGNLRLQGGKKALSALWIIALSVGALFIFVLIWIRRFIKKSAPAGGNGLNTMMIERAKEHAALHFSDSGFSLEQMADALNIGKRSLSETFRKETGLRFHDYLNGIRIEEAKKRLRESNETISEIAFGVGFGTLFHFERVFKDLEHVTPKQYRLKYRTLKH